MVGAGKWGQGGAGVSRRKAVNERVVHLFNLFNTAEPGETDERGGDGGAGGPGEGGGESR